MTDQTSTSPYPDGGGPEGLGGPAGRGAVTPDQLTMGDPYVVAENPLPGPALPPGFAEWADRWFARVIPETQRKAAEYGSNSLSKKGWRLAQVQGRLVDGPGALRLGVAQYAVEKADRAEDAMLRGTEASADTWSDLAVYALMHLYISDTGVWP